MHTRKLTPLTELLASGGATLKSQAPSSKLQIPSKPSASVAAAAAKPVAAPVKASSQPNAEPRIPDPGPDARLKDKLLAEIRSGKATFYSTVVAQAQRIDAANDRVTFVFGPAHSALRGLFDQQKAWLDAAAERVAGRKIAVVSELVAAARSNTVADPASRPSTGSGRPEALEGRIPDPGPEPSEKKRDLKAEAMSSSTVQAMLDVFPAEIRDVEEM
jgi:hypothetical protein